MAQCLVFGVLLAGMSPTDEVLPDGTIYHHFDYGLMAKIHARNEAKRQAAKKWEYDPVTWLPVEKDKPAHPRARSAKMQRRLPRRPPSYSGGDPLWWIHAPAMPNPRCPWSYVVLPAY